MFTVRSEPNEPVATTNLLVRDARDQPCRSHPDKIPRNSCQMSYKLRFVPFNINFLCINEADENRQ
jgi:hypothetical protein